MERQGLENICSVFSPMVTASVYRMTLLEVLCAQDLLAALCWEKCPPERLTCVFCLLKLPDPPGCATCTIPLDVLQLTKFVVTSIFIIKLSCLGGSCCSVCLQRSVQRQLTSSSSYLWWLQTICWSLFALGMGTSFSWCKFGVAELYFLLLELLGLSCAVDPAPLDDTRSMLLSLGSGGLGHVAGWVPNKVGSQAVLHLVGKHFLP